MYLYSVLGLDLEHNMDHQAWTIFTTHYLSLYYLDLGLRSGPAIHARGSNPIVCILCVYLKRIIQSYVMNGANKSNLFLKKN